MYILEPENGFVSSIKYIEKEQLDISELRNIKDADKLTNVELTSDENKEYKRNTIRRDRLIFDDEYDENYDLMENNQAEDDFNKIFEDEYNKVEARLKENKFKDNKTTVYEKYEDINNHGILSTDKEEKKYSIKSIYDSIVNKRNDSLYYDDKKHSSKCDKCKGNDCYGDEEYAGSQKNCMKDKIEDEECEQHKPIIEDTEECKGKMCKEEEEQAPVVETEEIIESVPEEIIEDKEEVKEEEICDEDFNIIQGQITAEIEYDFSIIGKFIKKLTPNQVCDLHICLFKEALNNKMMNSADELMDIAVNKFKQMYNFQNDALNSMKSKMSKTSQITKTQIEAKAKEILNIINSFTDKLEELFRKLTLKQMLIIRKLVITVSMNCYLDKIVGAADNMEKGMSSKVNMYLNWLRRLIESHLDILCKQCNKSYYIKK